MFKNVDDLGATSVGTPCPAPMRQHKRTGGQETAKNETGATIIVSVTRTNLAVDHDAICKKRARFHLLCTLRITTLRLAFAFHVWC
mmetsp:Transcript_26371/g.51693  ORF Transcript_26371/g.51693 Transcript_26371/m.51693 type:complete len:86 (+) Transcript_26371:119-376(+)